MPKGTADEVYNEKIDFGTYDFVVSGDKKTDFNATKFEEKNMRANVISCKGWAMLCIFAWSPGFN